MSRFGGLSEERPSVFKTRSKLGTHLSTQCSGDEGQSRPCAAHVELIFLTAALLLTPADLFDCSAILAALQEIGV
ncbi:hypothetical protein TNCV_4315331 [Trichonephila clavipes]|nr:hypothetical protein TNCV_4315331 [Trichonephila clavipes]